MILKQVVSISSPCVSCKREGCPHRTGSGILECRETVAGSDRSLHFASEKRAGRMSLQRQLLFWVGFILVLVALLYALRGILLPFVAGMALAYLLDPVADRLQRLGLSRVVATMLIL